METPVVPARPRQRRHQTGGVRLRSGFWYVQYYTERVENGITVRKRVLTKLVQKDERHYSAKCKAVANLQAEFMQRVNAGADGDAEKDNNQEVLVTEFWETTYLPFVRENLRASTVRGYEILWQKWLAAHFAGHTLSG